KFLIALQRLARYLPGRPCFPSIQELRNRELARVDVLARFDPGFEAHELGLGLPARPLERVVSRLTLSGCRIGAEVKLDLPATFAASANMASHVLVPSGPLGGEPRD